MARARRLKEKCSHGGHGVTGNVIPIITSAWEESRSGRSRWNCHRPSQKRAGVTLPLYFFAFSEVSSVVSLLFGVAFKTWNSCNAGDSTTVTPFWFFHGPSASISPLSPSPVESLYH